MRLSTLAGAAVLAVATMGSAHANTDYSFSWNALGTTSLHINGIFTLNENSSVTTVYGQSAYKLVGASGSISTEGGFWGGYTGQIAGPDPYPSNQNYIDPIDPFGGLPGGIFGFTSTDGFRWSFESFGNSTDFYSQLPGVGAPAGDIFMGSSHFELALISPTVSPVPEPETYAMLIAGLGLLTFAARRARRPLHFQA